MDIKGKRRSLVGVSAILVIGLFFVGYQVNKSNAETVKVNQIPNAASKSYQDQGVSGSGMDNYWSPFDSRVDPLADLARIQRQMDRLYREAFRQDVWHNGIAKGRALSISSDISDQKDKYVVKMDIPGMEKDKINVEIQDNQLLISGERKRDNEEENANYYARQRSFGSFSQLLTLPDDANTKSISADYKNGVLTIDVPKLANTKKQGKQPTKIKVN